jgi:hypothetical protein
VAEKTSPEFPCILESAHRLAWTSLATTARAEVIDHVDCFFHSKLTSHPAICVCIDRLQQA